MKSYKEFLVENKSKKIADTALKAAKGDIDRAIDILDKQQANLFGKEEQHAHRKDILDAIQIIAKMDKRKSRRISGT